MSFSGRKPEQIGPPFTHATSPPPDTAALLAQLAANHAQLVVNTARTNELLEALLEAVTEDYEEEVDGTSEDDASGAP